MLFKSRNILTSKTAAKVAEELNQSTKNSDIKEGIQHTKAKLGASFKKMGKQSTPWLVH